ncbi:MAG: hypothetical protein Q9203_007403 [Teloschistes exilis]
MATANYAPMQQRLLDGETAFAALPVQGERKSRFKTVLRSAIFQFCAGFTAGLLTGLVIWSFTKPAREGVLSFLDLEGTSIKPIEYDDRYPGPPTPESQMALRHSLYDSWNGSEHAHMTLHHRRHCLEYLRQTIMCSADPNMERRIFFESEPNMAPGWGLHHCRDYSRIKDFAEEWRVWDGKTPPEKRPVTSPEVLKGRVIYY